MIGLYFTEEDFRLCLFQLSNRGALICGINR